MCTVYYVNRITSKLGTRIMSWCLLEVGVKLQTPKKMGCKKRGFEIHLNTETKLFKPWL